MEKSKKQSYQKQKRYEVRNSLFNPDVWGDAELDIPMEEDKIIQEITKKWKRLKTKHE